MAKKNKTPQKDKLKHKHRERWVYIIILAMLAVYGLVDSQQAVKLIDAIYKAFSLIIN